MAIRSVLMAVLMAVLFVGCEQEPVATEIKETVVPADVPLEKSDGDAKIDVKSPPAPVAE